MRQLMAVLLLGAVTGVAHADIFKCISPHGDVLFTSDRVEAKQKNCTQITVTPNVISAPPKPAAAAPAPRVGDAKPAPSAAPGGFPKVSPQTQAQRDTDRRRILETELVNEEKSLQEARRDLAEQENTRTGSERNYQRVLERIEPYQRKVKIHEENIANLKRELNNLR
ncbi:MAG: DUF4124 domain-containing protein [Betaproteobacteria bacterium]|nr:DUF4124 domain-containing protein [Betaproteobacteria bacterium]